MWLDRINLPKVERFACTPRQVKAAFDIEGLWSVSFGKPSRTFSFDTRARGVPRISGTVVASLSITRQGKAYLGFYPVRRDFYPDAAATEFADAILTHLSAWLVEMRSRPETAILGHEQSVVEWTGQAHLIHRVRFQL